MKIEAAQQIAQQYHSGQVDKAGVDYFNGHLTAVASQITDNELAQCTAYLHDIIEDCDLTLDQLKAELTEKGLDEQDAATITRVGQLLTKPKIDYFDYLRKVKSAPLARIV